MRPSVATLFLTCILASTVVGCREAEPDVRELAPIGPVRLAKPVIFSGVCYIVSDNDDENVGYCHWGWNEAWKTINGDLSRISSVMVYVDGRQEGPEISYSDYSAGKVSKITIFRNGKKHGRCIRFGHDGSVLSDGVYRKGEEWSGTFTVVLHSWDDDTSQTGYETYAEGEIIKEFVSFKSRIEAQSKNHNKKGLEGRQRPPSQP